MKGEEKLFTREFWESIEAYLKDLKEIVKLTDKAVRKAPKGSLRISSARGKPQFYHCEQGDHYGTYICKKDFDIVHKLAQKSYDKNINELCKREIHAIEHLINTCKKESIEGEFKKLCKNRQSLIKPVFLQDDEFVRQWMSYEYPEYDAYLKRSGLVTSNGIHVRSKSEVLIAEALNRHKIPYRYECPIVLEDGNTFHPDFFCLNKRTRREFLWEHFGMLGMPEYLNSAINKIEKYIENGIYLGDNLLVTMETDGNGLNLDAVENLINKFLC